MTWPAGSGRLIRAVRLPVVPAVRIAMGRRVTWVSARAAERLFLSHRTVGAHLYRIFPKLGITARAGLREALSVHES